MKRYIYHTLIIFLLFLVQISAFKVFSSAQTWFPQLLLLWVIILALNSSAVEAIWLSFLAGFINEIASIFYFGTWIAVFLIIGLATYFLTRKLTPRELSIPLALSIVVVSTALLPLLIFAYNLFLSGLGLSEGLSLSTLYSFGIIITLISNLLFFYPLQYIYKIIPEKEKGLN